MRLYGLIGYPLGHSFSERYFSEKFAREGVKDAEYRAFELPEVEALPELVGSLPELRGLNVTIPHKRAVLPYLDALDERAERIGAVNTIRIDESGRLTGYNTDYDGFRETLEAFLGEEQTAVRGLVLGTGGAAQAVFAVLEDLDVPFLTVSRSPSRQEGRVGYDKLDEETLRNYRLIVNATPLGMAPKAEGLPKLPYEALGEGHYLYDLVYNPEETRFLAEGRKRGARTVNGLPKLHGQAEAAWRLWNEP